ncbi:kynureninase [Glycomyces tarimensis]
MNPRDLAGHYSKFNVADRLLLTGHSHQAWPDVALEGLVESFEDAARHVDAKWESAFAKAEQVRESVRGWIDAPRAPIALGSSTHELLVVMLSSVDFKRRRRIVTTDAEFHSASRQLRRLGEAGIELDVVAAEPVSTLAERMSERIDENTAVAFVSSVLFTNSLRVPNLGALADRSLRAGCELVVDAYHHVGPVPFSVPELGLGTAWIVGGGYKYLQWGEGVCYLRIPEHALRYRPVITGWFAEFGALESDARPDAVPYAAGQARFAGSTYDPSSHYRAARVVRFFDDQGLTPQTLAASYERQIHLLMDAFDKLDLPETLISRADLSPAAVGGFLTLSSSKALEIQRDLARAGVMADARGPHLRFGPAPYLRDDQLTEAVGRLEAIVRDLAAQGFGEG